VPAAVRSRTGHSALGALAVLIVALAVMVGASSVARAWFTDSDTTGASLAADTLAPPTGLGATGGSNVVLTWTATTDAYAAGYHLFRATASGGPYSQIAVVTPRTTVTYTDNPANGTYWYQVRSYAQNWESVDAGPVSASVPLPDTTPPVIGTSVVSKTTQYLPGSIKPSASVYVYANVTDTGSGASGVATVTADVSSIKAGSTAVALTAGSYTVGGVSYGYRSAALTADAKPAGTYGYSIRAVDNAGNIATRNTFSVVVDATVPAGSDIQTTNAGTAGRPETGDKIIYTFTEQIDPESILSGWTGASQAVTIRFTNSGGNDSVAIWNAANAVQLPFGTVATGGNFVTAASVFTGTMVQSGATITVTLGTLSSGAVNTYGAARAMTWTPSATATDAAGNACSTTAKTESGAVDLDF
jgi:hypothetical protein